MEKKISVIKNDILGKNYSLSIAYVDKKKSKEINKAYRSKNKPTNILSFPLSPHMGEIILCPSIVKKDTRKFKKTFNQLMGFLVIHGMLHLKGYEHSSTMKTLEEKYDQKYFSRNRCRVVHNESGGRRVFKRRKKS